MSLCFFLFCDCPLSHPDLISWEREGMEFLSLLPFHLFIWVSHLKSYSEAREYWTFWVLSSIENLESQVSVNELSFSESGLGLLAETAIMTLVGFAFQNLVVHSCSLELIVFLLWRWSLFYVALLNVFYWIWLIFLISLFPFVWVVSR